MRKGDTFAKYYIDFNVIMADLTIDEESQLIHLRQGLSLKILVALVFIPEEPSTVADMTRICQRIDNRQRALKGQLTLPSPKNPTPTPAPTRIASKSRVSI